MKVSTWILRVLVLLNAAAVFALGASRQNWPSYDFWQRANRWLLLSLAVTAVIPIIQLGFSEHAERVKRKDHERRDLIEPILVVCLGLLVRNANAHWETTGVQAFLVEKKGLKREPQHVRAAKVRMSSIASSGVKWTKNKGVIGRCWEERRRQFVDLANWTWTFRNHDEPTWDRMSEAQRFGLSFKEFKTLQGKYGIVAAVPIIDGSDKYIGCIALDTPPESECVKEEAFRALEMASGLVSKVIKA